MKFLLSFLWLSWPILVHSSDTGPHQESSQVSADNQVNWPASLPSHLLDSLNEARETRKPLLIDFTAKWCGPCKMMDRQVIPDPVVARELTHWVKVKIDRDEFPQLAQSFEVTALPYYILIAENGQILATAAGFQIAEDFADWLVTARNR